jgi:hypothetical protein
MKTMVKLAVLIATLLLLTGGAFADGIQDCKCYKVTYDELDYPWDYGTEDTLLCFNYENNTGSFGNLCGGGGSLSLFFDDPVQALVYTVSQSPVVGYLKFHDMRLTVLNGILYCPGASRYNLWGRIEDPSNCK